MNRGVERQGDVLEILYVGQCEPLKAVVHGVLMGTVALYALYNSAAWVRRREPHLAVNALIYTAATAWEYLHTQQHLLRYCSVRNSPPRTDTAHLTIKLLRPGRWRDNRTEVQDRRREKQDERLPHRCIARVSRQLSMWNLHLRLPSVGCEGGVRRGQAKLYHCPFGYHVSRPRGQGLVDGGPDIERRRAAGGGREMRRC